MRRRSAASRGSSGRSSIRPRIAPSRAASSSPAAAARIGDVAVQQIRQRARLAISCQPSGENVAGLKTRGDSSGFVNAWENASIATIRPISAGSTALRRTSSANRPGTSSIRSDVAVERRAGPSCTRAVAGDVGERAGAREAREPAVLVVRAQPHGARLLDAGELGVPDLRRRVEQPHAPGALARGVLEAGAEPALHHGVGVEQRVLHGDVAVADPERSRARGCASGRAG